MPMRKWRWREMIRTLLIAIFAISASGCYESILELHPDSPLPKWIIIPDNVNREEVQVKFFLSLEGRVDIEVYLNGRSIESVRGKKIWHPKSIQKGLNTYPTWSIIEVKGVSEIYEHRQLGHWLYIVDHVDS
jgi:hypothetical protein